ncbi:glycosyltransferase involved in cell wall biosynthesis [Inquilinus ginsengisoli]|uniref:Glycosyltransferase involved in cell wall biosynthesis n=1 Tax=Inquilinus ginsengisoli TaxID=363840 RepID=A0ABU1JSX6_9PROT|nr:glycosyltransferase family 1 protein [Inquilinus ginsengisoli]MDR6290674.1 glycosyltransferase involved in cell wall biosynthesis [Inquilinus ginsengisoli]
MTPQTIMIDGYNLGLETGTGVATYARNLSYELHNLGYRTEVLYGGRSAPSTQTLMREIAFFDPNVGTPPRWLEFLRYVNELVHSPGGVRAKPVPITGKVIAKTYRSRMPYYDQISAVPDVWNRAYRHFAIYRNRMTITLRDTPQLMHWTYPLPMRLAGAKNIYTIHDLVPLRLPYTTLDNKRRYHKLVRMLLRRADHIVTVSETSKRDIVDLFGYPEERITNTYQAVDIPAKYAEKPEDAVKREVEGTFNLTYKGYLLYFGAIEPKKNIGRLIEAYLASQIKTPLVIIGKLAWKTDQELRMLNDPSIRYLEQVDTLTYTRDRVHRIDYAPFPLLVSLIRGAKAVTFPSLYEGFGLPVLEAMRLGTPVLASTEGALPEVAGDAALLVDPYDTHALAEAIRGLDGNAELRGDLARRGLQQAALYSPERYRARLAEMYRRLLPAGAAAPVPTGPGVLAEGE